MYKTPQLRLKNALQLLQLQLQLHMARLHMAMHMYTTQYISLTCETVFLREAAICRIRSVSGSMPGRMLRNSSPRGPAGRLSLSYLPVNIPDRRATRLKG